ncbi:MAG: hypothetical protein ACYDAO_01030 [Thermoplasmataceae archaeon]
MTALDPTIILALVFVIGLLLGLAIKKGIVALILALVAIFLASYIGFSLATNYSFQDILSKIGSHVGLVITKVESLVSIGFAGALSITLVLFIVGLLIGLWKG